MRTYLIGQLANKVGVNVETIRFYQQKGLILEPVKPSDGYRKYSEMDEKRLQFILYAKQVGFTLKEIQKLLELNDIIGKDTCENVKTIAQDKIKEIQEKIELLTKFENNLQKLVNSCETDVTKECPILSAFEKEI